MERTKFPRKRQPNKKKENKEIEIRTTEDGRFLGRPTVEKVPENMKAVVPPTKSEKDPKDHGKLKGQRKAVQALSRTLMPLAFTPDGEILHEGYEFRLVGLNQARFNALIAGFRTGMNITSACKLAGISTMAYRSWMEKAEQGITPYTYLAAIIRESEAELEKKLLQSIVEAGTQQERTSEIITEYLPDQVHEITGEIYDKPIRKRTIEREGRKHWAAAGWILERTRAEYKSDYVPPKEDLGNQLQYDLFAMNETIMHTTEGEGQDGKESDRESGSLS